MTVTRRTVSIPAELAKEVERVSRSERVSFSRALSELADEALRRRRHLKKAFRSLGAGVGGPADLGENHEKYLDEIFRERDD